MTFLLKKLLSNAALVAGLLLTLAAVVLDATGTLTPIERFLLDQRMRLCQFYMPPPTDRLVHLDIDDGALETIGLWPWDRATLAQIMDELALAKPAAVGLDLLFTEPQAPSWRKQADGTFELVDGDALFAASLQRLGNAVVPASFPFPASTSNELFSATREALTENPALTESQLVSILRSQKWGNDPQLLSKVSGDPFLAARRIAMYNRLRRELQQDPSIGDDVVRSRVLPKLDLTLKSPLSRLFEVQLTRARAALEMRRFGRATKPGEPPAFPARLNLVPIYPLVHAAGASAFVDYPQSADGRTRSVPLFVKHDGLLYPQMGLSLACATMGVKLDDVRIEPGRIVIPRPVKGELSVPTRTLDPSQLSNVSRDVPLAIELPWFGTDDWEQMYNPTGSKPRNQHVSIMAVWAACDAKQKLERNNRQADVALLSLYEAGGDTGKVKELESNPLPPEETEQRLKRIHDAVEENAFSAEATEALSPKEREPKHEVFLKCFKALKSFAAETPGLIDDLKQARAALSKTLGSKAVIVGWIATASIADFVPTPLHAKCPGPVLHGVVFNAIMTGEVWRRAPAWVSPILTLLVGLFTTGIVAFFAPGRALLAALAFATAYLSVNGLILFDRGNLIVGAAGPLTAIGMVFSGGTLLRLIVEQRRRELIRRKFRTYVDPKLVDYFEHDPNATTAGEKRELTVVFTDLVGFTKMTEALGEETVKLLNELWSQVVPIVWEDNGFLNKFLGDGVMFFHGAPQPNERHAVAAVNTVLKLREVMALFNETVTRPRGLPELGMRFGISTGDMIVGDAGGGGGSDYTVLGDNVNLGSRLEGANKATGTTNLMTARTMELATGAFLFRPVGKLRVVGKQQGVMTYEAVCPMESATAEQRQSVEMTCQMVHAYAAQNFADCVAVSEKLEALMGPYKLAQLYRKLAKKHIEDPGAEPFDGLITLSEK